MSQLNVIMEFKVKSLSSTKITIQRESVTGVKPSQKKTKRKRSKEKTFELRINLDSASTSATRKSESLHDCFNGASDYVGIKSENKFMEHNNVVVKSEPAWDEGYGVSTTVQPIECNGETSQLAPSPDFGVKSEFSCAFDIENATIVQVNMEPDADIHADIFGYKAETEEHGNFKASFVTVKKEPDIEYPFNVSNIKTEPVFVAQSDLENSTAVLTDPHDNRGTDNYDLTTKDENVIIKTEPNQSNDDRMDGCNHTEGDFELEIDLADEILEEVDQDRSEDYVPSSEESDEEYEKDKSSKSKKWKEEDLSLPVRFGQLPADPVIEVYYWCQINFI